MLKTFAVEIKKELGVLNIAAKQLVKVTMGLLTFLKHFLYTVRLTNLIYYTEICICKPKHN